MKNITWLHLKSRLQKPKPPVNMTLKKNLLDYLIKQNMRSIVLKYFVRATYYCSIIAIIQSRKIILNMRSIIVIIEISCFIYCGNQCKFPLLIYVILQKYLCFSLQCL